MVLACCDRSAPSIVCEEYARPRLLHTGTPRFRSWFALALAPAFTSVFCPAGRFDPRFDVITERRACIIVVSRAMSVTKTGYYYSDRSAKVAYLSYDTTNEEGCSF
jgi:hypothetical protein